MLIPSIEQIRFVNSGTESIMSAVRLAKAYTERRKIIKFSGAYHGHSDQFLVHAGSGNDIDSIRALFQQYPQDIAGARAYRW